MFRNIKCMKNTMKRECNKRQIKEILNETIIINSKLQEVNRLQNRLKKYIENESLEEVLKFDMEVIDECEIYYDDTEHKKMLQCKLNPDVCEINMRINQSKLEKLDSELKEKINLYNNDISVLYKLKNHYIKADKISKEMYLKFGRDKNNNLIGLYFDIDDFINRKLSTVYLFTQEQEYFYPSVLFLKYEDYLEYGPRRYINEKDKGYALICDFRVKTKRIGHGTFMLSNIEPILKKVNKKIRYINRNVVYDDRIMFEIAAVNGMVGPGEDTSYEDLVKFYNQNGYPTYSNGRIENKNIYKEI